MRPVKDFFFAAFLAALLLVACSKRGNPARVPPPASGIEPQQPPVFFGGTLDAANNVLIKSLRGTDGVNRRVRVYLPPGYRIRDEGRPFPTLYLLHDFGAYTDIFGNPYGGSDSYFGLYELGALMDGLIAAGEIQPMIVVQTDATNYYGGSFYTNSTSTARYFTAIDSFLVNFVDRNYNTVYGRRSRAVSGVGMGGYGAIKLVLTGNDTTFGSVSALSAPLALADTLVGCLSPFYRNALFSENGIAPGDSAAYRNDAVLFSDPKFTTKPRTNLLFAMGAAFSPADPAYAGRRNDLLDSFPNYFQFSTLFDDPGFLFPIDHNGKLIDSVRQRWLTHDLRTLLSGSSARLDSTPFYFSCGLQDQLGMLDQNRVFRDSLLTHGFSAASSFVGMNRAQFFRKFYYEEYSGYSGRPADHTTFLADQLVKVLKFHSQFLDTAAVP